MALWHNLEDDTRDFHEILDEFLPENPPEETCPMCSGPLVFLGRLGRYNWFRCRNCGLDINSDRQYQVRGW